MTEDMGIRGFESLPELKNATSNYESFPPMLGTNDCHQCLDRFGFAEPLQEEVFVLGTALSDVGRW